MLSHLSVTQGLFRSLKSVLVSRVVNVTSPCFVLVFWFCLFSMQSKRNETRLCEYKMPLLI